MKKLTFILCFMGICCMLCNCTKEDTSDDTVVLLGKESYVIPMMDMIPDTLQDKFLTQMGNPPVGFIPPNIEVSNGMVLPGSGFSDTVAGTFAEVSGLRTDDA